MNEPISFEALNFRLKRQNEMLTYISNLVGMELLSELDKEAEEKVGEGVVPEEHIFEAAFKRRLLNAFKAGMTKAAYEGVKHANVIAVNSREANIIVAFQQAILAVRDNTTTLP